MSDDITFCMKFNCTMVKGCDMNPKNIRHPEIPHSFAYYEGTEYCPKVLKQKQKDAKKGVQK